MLELRSREGESCYDGKGIIPVMSCHKFSRVQKNDRIRMYSKSSQPQKARGNDWGTRCD